MEELILFLLCAVLLTFAILCATKYEASTAEAFFCW
jgi:hypothetical protein